MFEGANAAKYVVKPDVFNKSVHGSFACADCHQDLAGVKDFPHKEHLAPVNCGTCHERRPKGLSHQPALVRPRARQPAGAVVLGLPWGP